MANSLYNLALDFSKELNYTKAIMARQGDKGITVTVKPFLNGLQMDTSGGTFTLKGTTPSNRYVDSVATSVTSEEVTFSLDGTFMSEAGYYKHCYVEYRKGDQILTTQDITFFSLGVSDISQGQADEYVSQLEELIRKYNETFDAFMAEIKGRVNSLNKQITDLTGQAKTLQEKLDTLKEEISKLGNLQVMYSNDANLGDTGEYKYRGVGMRESDNPEEYVWDLSPKYVENNLATDTKISEIVSQANNYTDGKASEINSQLTAAINAVDEKATNNTADLTNQVNNNKVLIQKNKDRIIGGYRVNDLMRKTHYSAHRGNNADFPENSSMAMKKVIRHKFSECDVQTTSDGKWVVMHDATVDRMTNGTGRVDSFTYEELRKLRIDTGNNLATLPDWEKVIPNLDEAIKYNRMAGTIPMIEIKVDEGTTYTDEELADFVNQLKLNNLDKGGCIVISFSADVLRKLRSLSETLEIMWVTYDMSDATLNTCKELRMHVDPQYSHETVTRSQIQKYHDNGLLVSVWTCPDDKFADMEDRGVDIITTNSRSGDLKWGKLTLKNGFTGVTWAGYLPPCVEEITKGILRVSCTVLNGSNTQNTVIAEFPSWAQPYLNSAGLGMVRTTSTIEQCSVDVIGKIAGTPSLVVGLGWESRSSWAMINIDYKIL